MATLFLSADLIGSRYVDFEDLPLASKSVKSIADIGFKMSAIDSFFAFLCLAIDVCTTSSKTSNILSKKADLTMIEGSSMVSATAAM